MKTPFFAKCFQCHMLLSSFVHFWERLYNSVKNRFQMVFFLILDLWPLLKARPAVLSPSEKKKKKNAQKTSPRYLNQKPYGISPCEAVPFFLLKITPA